MKDVIISSSTSGLFKGRFNTIKRSGNFEFGAPPKGGGHGKPPKSVSQVSGLTATVLSDTSIRLNWNAVQGAGAYRVYRNGVLFSSTAGSVTTFLDSGLVSSTAYTYQVSCIINSVEGPLSVAVTVTTNPPPGGGNYTYKDVLYVNFDGGVVTSSRFGLSNATIEPSGLTSLEVADCFARIQEAWAQDHPNIIVTMDKSIYDQADPYKRQTTHITATNLFQAGGVTVLGSFNFGDDTPNFVFSQLLYYSPINCWVSCVHEQGHSLGLRHAINVCGENYALSVVAPDGIRRNQYMGGSYGDFPHYFQTPERCALYGTPDMDISCVVGINEDTIIESKL